jgi:carbonic anhydrase
MSGSGVSQIVVRGSRRFFAGQAMLAAACGGAGWLRSRSLTPEGVEDNGGEAPGSVETPQGALDFLYAGNRRFSECQPRDSHRDMERVREVASVQRPFAAFPGCADSREPIEIISIRALATCL